jgi:hypothetical protein
MPWVESRTALRRSEPMPKRTDISKGLILGAAYVFMWVACSTWLFACQETCVVLETSARQALIEDRDGKPLGHVEVIIRDASKNAAGPECFCGRFGPIISHVFTDVHGGLDLRGLRPGHYWITYMNPEDGESFYVSIENGKRTRVPIQLQIDHVGGRCYLIDMERNETKPVGWTKPLSPSNAQTH